MFGKGFLWILNDFQDWIQYRILPLKLQWTWTWVSYGKLEFAYLLISLGISSVSGWLPSPPPRFLGDLAEAAETARTRWPAPCQSPRQPPSKRQRVVGVDAREACSLTSRKHGSNPVSCWIPCTIHAILCDISCFRNGRCVMQVPGRVRIRQILLRAWRGGTTPKPEDLLQAVLGMGVIGPPKNQCQP